MLKLSVVSSAQHFVATGLLSGSVVCVAMGRKGKRGRDSDETEVDEPVAKRADTKISGKGKGKISGKGKSNTDLRVGGNPIDSMQLQLSSLNAKYLQEIQSMLTDIKTAENYAGIFTAAAAKGDNAIIAPYDKATVQAALENHNKCICGESIFATSWVWTPTPMVPYNKAQADYIRNHYFDEPSSLPFTTVVALPHGESTDNIEKTRGGLACGDS